MYDSLDFHSCSYPPVCLTLSHRPLLTPDVLPDPYRFLFTHPWSSLMWVACSFLSVMYHCSYFDTLIVLVCGFASLLHAPSCLWYWIIFMCVTPCSPMWSNFVQPLFPGGSTFLPLSTLSVSMSVPLSSPFSFPFLFFLFLSLFIHSPSLFSVMSTSSSYDSCCFLKSFLFPSVHFVITFQLFLLLSLSICIILYWYDRIFPFSALIYYLNCIILYFLSSTCSIFFYSYYF